MKKLNALKIFVLFTLMISCDKKSDPDVRDSFIGNWTWHYTLNCSGNGSPTTAKGDSQTIITKSSSTSGVTFTFGSTTVNGTVSGILLSIPLQTIGSTKYEGDVTVSGGKLDIDLDQTAVNNVNSCNTTGLATKN